MRDDEHPAAAGAELEEKDKSNGNHDDQRNVTRSARTLAVVFSYSDWTAFGHQGLIPKTYRNLVGLGLSENGRLTKIADEEVGGFVEMASPLHCRVVVARTGEELNRVVSDDLDVVEIAILNVEGLARENRIVS